MRFLPVNLDALLVELDDLQTTLALLASLQAEPLAGIVELVPAARTLLIRYRPTAVSHADLVARIAGRSLQAAADVRPGSTVEIPVDYRGEDLDEVAALLGVSREEVIRRHTGSDYTVAFTGFAPGFAYLSGGATGLDVPRRKTPRTRIPAGAVGLAGAFSGVYPQASPGGWQIIGVTALPMWDLDRDPPALLQPGARVRFVDVTGRPSMAPPPTSQLVPATAVRGESAAADRVESAVADRVASDADDGAARLVVEATGLQALFQDLGRHGQAGQGVSASGAMDRAALRAANRLVGNPGNTVCVETVYGGFQLLCGGAAVVVAVTGAAAPIELTTAAGARCSVASHQPIALNDGDRLRLGEPHAGIRCYLAVRGGFAVAPVLGSRSTDTLANVGPPAIEAGDVLRVQSAPRVGRVVGAPEEPPGDLPTTGQMVVLDVVLGPRTDWFTAEALELLSSQLWTVTPQSNRVGLRLAGDEPLARANPGELPSEGTAAGAIQVPASGQPVLFLADHPLTGGYPVIANVAIYHLDRAGQIPIGARLRFNPIRHPGLRGDPNGLAPNIDALRSDPSRLDPSRLDPSSLDPSSLDRHTP